MRRAIWAPACAVGCVAIVGLAACSKSNPPKQSPVTVTVKPSPSTSASPTHSTPTPTPTPTLKHMTKLPGTCDGLLSLYDVQTAAGVPVPGKTAFIVGIPEKNIDRLANINCRYGLAAANSAPKIEIGVNLYGKASEAGERVTGTIQDYVGNGATQQPVTVAGFKGTALIGGHGDYAVPLLVVAVGQRTISVSVATSLVPAAKLPTALVKIGALTVKRTAG